MVEKNGTVNYGTYRAPFRKPNILDAPLYRFNAPVFWKNFRLKEWQHFAIITPTHYLGTVIFDAKLIGVSFFLSTIGGVMSCLNARAKKQGIARR